MWLGSFGRRLGLGLGGLEEGTGMFVWRSWGLFGRWTWAWVVGSGSCCFVFVVASGCPGVSWAWVWFLFLARRWRGTCTRPRELSGLSCPNIVVTAVEDISVLSYLLSIMQECMDQAYLIYGESKEQYCKIPGFDVVF